MGRRSTLSDDGVRNLKPRAQRYAHPDPELSGHFVRVTPTGAKSFVAVANDPVSKRQVWATIASPELIGIEEARTKARAAIRRIRAGLPPFEAPAVAPETFADVSANWLKRHVEARGLRSQREIERMLDRYVTPAWKDRIYADIRRGDVAHLLDAIEDKSGPSQADAVLAIIRGMANWYATRHEDYVSPFTRGMKRMAPTKRARILTDDELRLVWQAAEDTGNHFGPIVRLCLLTAQRREKVAAMRWADINGDEWAVPQDKREKGTGGALLLPPVAAAIVKSQARIAENLYVFPGRGDGHFNGFSPCKRRFDQSLPADFPPWTVHDLRRSARSLMSRAGVRPEIAERVLGHVIAGVEGVYDRHAYREEKRDALQRLASLIETILSPPARNVVSLHGAKP